ncbi:MAG: type IV secretion system protein VirB5, partial [Crenarchaeota archaeon]|nr:type IV secretion system protein VirB5 [Thermoproteota archaeon]
SAVSLTFALSGVVNAQGIPVIDATAIAKHLEQIVHMKQQIENQVSQIVELKNQVEALTSEEGLKNVAQELALDNIPAEWEDIYKNVDSLSKTDVDNIINKRNYDPDGGRKLLANYSQSVEKSFKETAERFERLNSLQTKLQTATNVKEAADIQNQIATESAAIAVTQTQLDNMQRAYEIQRGVHAEQHREAEFCANAVLLGWETDGKCS